MQLTINVLGVREDDVWCAIALEMSLRGYGTTFDDALHELHEAIEAQISFAVQNNTVDQIFIPTEPHYFKLYADLKRAALKRSVLERKESDLPDYRVGDIALPKPAGGQFTQATA